MSAMLECLLCSSKPVEPVPLIVDVNVHRECMLRSALGGIGHLVAHELWCVERHDPDAGLTYRQSALLVDAWARIVGPA